VKIMSLNAWGGRLYDELAAFIAAQAPDVLCLQEVVRTAGAPGPWLTYRDHGIELPQRANLFDDIAAILPSHDAVFCPAAQGDLWDADRALPSQWGLATFVRSEIPVTAQAHGFVHGEFSPHGYGAHPRSRTAHAVRLFDYATDRAVTIAHMHGLRDPGGKHNTPERLAQAHRLVSLTRSVASPSDAIVMCGDFNVLPGSETFEVLKAFGMTDLVTGRGFGSTRTAWYSKPEPFADYMLVNAAVRVKDFNVVTQPEVSDHCPLWLEIA